MADEMAGARVVPYLTVKGGDDAVAFYEKAFGAKLDQRMQAEDGKRLMHASLSLFGGTLMLSDEFGEYQTGVHAPPTLGGTTTTVTVMLDRPAMVDAAIDKAVAAGAEPKMPATDMFWGARYGQIRDPFGHVWAFNAQIG